MLIETAPSCWDFQDDRQLGSPAARFGYCGVKRNSSRKRRVSRRFDSSMNDIIAGVSAACAWLIAICGGGGRSSKAAQRRKRSEEHTSELRSLMRISYAVFCLK